MRRGGKLSFLLRKSAIAIVTSNPKEVLHNQKKYVNSRSRPPVTLLRACGVMAGRNAAEATLRPRTRSGRGIKRLSTPAIHEVRAGPRRSFLCVPQQSRPLAQRPTKIRSTANNEILNALFSPKPAPPIMLMDNRLFERYTGLLEKWPLARRSRASAGDLSVLMV